MQWLLPQSVPGQHQAPFPLVPEGQGRHRVDRGDEFVSPFLIEVHQHLRIGAGLAPMSSGDQILFQFQVVVDLAVEDDPDGAIFVRDRLLPGLQIDDCQAPHTQGDGLPHVEPFVIGAAMNDSVSHRAQKRRIRGSRRVDVDVSGDAAHSVRGPVRCFEERPPLSLPITILAAPPSQAYSGNPAERLSCQPYQSRECRWIR